MYLAARLARLARQWIKERSISCFCEVWGSYIYGLIWLVWLASASKNPALSVGFMYLVARLACLALQWIKERSTSHCRAKRAGLFGPWLKVALHSVV